MYQNEQQKKYNKPNNIDPQLYLPTLLQSPYNAYFRDPVTIPIIKNYNITTGPTMNHVKIYNIIEDVIPPSLQKLSFDSINERLNLNGFIKKTMFDVGNGKKISLDDKPDSLLSQLKFLDINPYNSNKYSNNPYDGLPDGTLIFRSCYPIKHSALENTTVCAPKSIGMNIKIFGLKSEEFYICKDKNNMELKKNEYNIWREIEYYNCIYANILNKHICPHFIIYHGYYLSENCSIDFNKLCYIINNKNVNVLNNLLQDPYINKAIVLLTEAPDCSLFDWAKKIYVKNGNIQKMINSGYHNASEWSVVYFHIFVIFKILLSQQILFNNFYVEDNLFIKYLNNEYVNADSYWKYVIDDIEYFIPNYGFIVLFDSTYKNYSGKYKIESTHFNDVIDTNKIFTLFKQCLDCNIFNNFFKTNGGMSPPDEFINIMTQMYSEQFNNMNDYFYKYMRQFMHNRIGTNLQQQETDNMDENNKKFKKGNIVIHELLFKKYEFVLFVNFDANNMCTILTKKNQKFVEENVSVESLFMYNGVIQQSYNFDKSNINNIIETYIIY